MRLTRLLPLLFAALPLAAQTEIRPRVMVLVDTSGSMGFYFADPGTFDVPPFGDYPGGDGSYSSTDVGQTNAFTYPGKRITGTCTQANLSGCEGLKSRLWAAKRGVSQAIYGHGRIDFGLEAFYFQLCSFNNPRCETCTILCSPGCGFNCLYANNAFNAFASINWLSQATCGGLLIKTPGANSGAAALSWLDSVEDHRTSGDGNTAYGTGSTPANPELRADGPSPIAEAIDTARTGWYVPASGADTQANCRPYRLVVVTDSAESSACTGNPVTAATALYNANPANRVKTYVISLAPDVATRTLHNQIAAAGGTTQAFLAANSADVEAAFARIAAATIKVETCNNADDNCDGVTDEGFDKGGLCSVGVGGCRRIGMKKCTANGLGTQCCVDDGLPNGACTPLSAGTPTAETCNGIDDNCNGLTDEGLGGTCP